MAEEVEVMEQEQAPVVEEKPKKQVLKFSVEQQDLINNLIKEKYTEAYTKADTKYKTQLDSLRAELDSFKKNQEVKKVDNKEESQKNTEEQEEFRQLKDKLAESERHLELNRMNFEMLTEKQKALQNELEVERLARVQERKVNTLMSAAQKQKFIDPSLVVKLTGDLIKPTEEGSFKVFNEAGQERWNEFMKPMTIDEFMSEYAATHPFLVQGSNTGGSGAKEGKIHTGRKWTRSEIAKMRPADYEKYRNDIHKAAKEGRVIDG